MVTDPRSALWNSASELGEPRQERKQTNSRVRGKGYDYGKCGAADDHKSIWGPPACNCGAKVRYKIIKADGHKLRAEKHCKETGAFVWQGQPVERSTREVQKDWVPRGEFDNRIDDAVRSVHASLAMLVDDEVARHMPSGGISCPPLPSSATQQRGPSTREARHDRTPRQTRVVRR